jgi:hypothetical protein
MILIKEEDKRRPEELIGIHKDKEYNLIIKAKIFIKIKKMILKRHIKKKKKIIRKRIMK